jgi:steroid 5-alpha reductase family enzyme
MQILLATLLATLAAFTLLWALSLRLKDASIIDFYWGPGFAVIGWIAWAMHGPLAWPELLFLMLLTLWAVRLGWHMTMRHTGVEDPRYAEMRARHGVGFARKSLWMVFWLQAVIQWIASAPALVVFATEQGPAYFSTSDNLRVGILMLGALIFVAGFTVEVLADGAINRFKAAPSNRGQLLTSGLHSRMRHPNYLGEIILQWGFGVMAFGLTLNPFAFVGPALMHGLIVHLSGVPMLEAHLGSRPGFAEWKARTNALWPRLGR